MGPRSSKRRALLLDRDGTICREVGYVDTPEKLELLPGSADAIARASDAGFQIVVVTNQAGIARGRLDEETLTDVHDRLRTLLGEAGARLDGIYYCPHHPEGDHPRYGGPCTCRKPEPGLLLRARDEMGIDLAASYMVGDHVRDVVAAARAGVTPVLVRTGHGAGQIDDPQLRETLEGVRVEDDLQHAVRWIVEHGKRDS